MANFLLHLTVLVILQISSLYADHGHISNPHWPPWNKFIPALQFTNGETTWDPNQLSCSGPSEDGVGCMFNVTKACVLGLFVVYDDVGYQLINSSNLVYYGQAECVDTIIMQLSPLTFASYQAIGSTSNIYEDSISFFSYVNLGGEATVYTEHYHTNNITLPANFKSLVIYGSSTWILTTDIVYGTVNLRERVCLFVPYNPMHYPGFVADIYGELGFNQNVTRVIRQDGHDCPPYANGLYVRTYTVNFVEFPIGKTATNVVDADAALEIEGLA